MSNQTSRKLRWRLPISYGATRRGKTKRTMNYILDASSGTPAWLPAGAVVYADFVNGNYWSQGAIKTVEGVFVSVDSNTYDPVTDIDATGLIGGNPVLNATDFAILKGNFSVILYGLTSAGGGTLGIIQTNFDTHETDFYIWRNGGKDNIYASDATPSYLEGADGFNGLRRGGAVIADSGLKFCSEGGTVYTQTMNTPQANLVTNIFLQGHGGGGAVKTIAFYAGSLSNAQLQALTSP